MNIDKIFPVLFVSHGVPDILLPGDETNTAIRNLFTQPPEPKNDSGDFGSLVKREMV
jgi:hypothetical protein